MNMDKADDIKLAGNAEKAHSTVLINKYVSSFPLVI